MLAGRFNKYHLTQAKLNRARNPPHIAGHSNKSVSLGFSSAIDQMLYLHCVKLGQTLVVFKVLNGTVEFGSNRKQFS